MSRWWLYLCSKRTRDLWDAADAMDSKKPKPRSDMSIREMMDDFPWGDMVSYRSSDEIRSERRDSVATQQLTELKAIRVLLERWSKGNRYDRPTKRD